MKRSEMLLKLQEILVEAPEDLEAAANSILTRLEKSGMVFCSKRDLGEMGTLWVPEGWDYEDSEDN